MNEGVESEEREGELAAELGVERLGGIITRLPVIENKLASGNQ